jgi:hypothetical protein
MKGTVVRSSLLSGYSTPKLWIRANIVIFNGWQVTTTVSSKVKNCNHGVGVPAASSLNLKYIYTVPVI